MLLRYTRYATYNTWYFFISTYEILHINASCYYCRRVVISWLYNIGVTPRCPSRRRCESNFMRLIFNALICAACAFCSPARGILASARAMNLYTLHLCVVATHYIPTLCKNLRRDYTEAHNIAPLAYRALPQLINCHRGKRVYSFVLTLQLIKYIMFLIICNLFFGLKSECM